MRLVLSCSHDILSQVPNIFLTAFLYPYLCVNILACTSRWCFSLDNKPESVQCVHSSGTAAEPEPPGAHGLHLYAGGHIPQTAGLLRRKALFCGLPPCWSSVSSRQVLQPTGRLDSSIRHLPHWVQTFVLNCYMCSFLDHYCEKALNSHPIQHINTLSSLAWTTVYTRFSNVDWLW